MINMVFNLKFNFQIAALVTNPFDVVKTLYQIDFIGNQIMTGED